MNPGNVIVVAIRVQPRGSRSEIQGVKDGRLRIKTTAPPADGKANKDVIRHLASRHLRALKSGSSNRNKTIAISDPVVLPEWLREVNPKSQDRCEALEINPQRS